MRTLRLIAVHQARFSLSINRPPKNAICSHAFDVRLHPSSLRRATQVRPIPQDLPALHLIVLHRPARNTVYQRAVKGDYDVSSTTVTPIPP